MSKLTLNDLANLENETSAINVINNNNDAIEDAFDNTLSRDGTSPNAMSTTLDMNGYQILNIPAPSADNDVVRYQDISDLLTQFSLYANVTISTSNPSGGSNGDIWFKVAT